MSFGNLPSLGSATGSRVDSAAKHIMACKMDTKLLSNWRSVADRGTEAQSCLHNSKMKWCMHKDEIVLNTTKQNPLSGNSDSSVKAYPMVITTVGDMLKETRDFITEIYKSPSASEFAVQWKNRNDFITNQPLLQGPDNQERKKIVKEQITTLPEFRCQGVALGQAWASYLSGDTVASVLVGGMVTIQNGAFSMHTGDLVQWYFDWEQGEFDNTNRNTNGYRITVDPNNAEQTRDPKRKRYNDERLYATSTSLGRSSGQKSGETMVRVKSYRMNLVRVEGGADNEMYMFDHYGDKTRIFAKCISGGRPWDAVDIMLMTQSL
jgi:hypothetical protein